MPDRIIAPGNIVIKYVLIVLMCVTGITATLYAYTGANAVNALKTSSTRAECRTKVQNEDEDMFRHRIGELLEAAQSKNTALVSQLAHDIETEAATQDKIDQLCPAPLAGSDMKEHR